MLQSIKRLGNDSTHHKEAETNGQVDSEEAKEKAARRKADNAYVRKLKDEAMLRGEDPKHVRRVKRENGPPKDRCNLYLAIDEADSHVAQYGTDFRCASLLVMLACCTCRQVKACATVNASTRLAIERHHMSLVGQQYARLKVADNAAARLAGSSHSKDDLA